jgi:hypothetical protein
LQNSIENIEEIDLIVTADMCDTMVKTRTCENSAMICDNGICKSQNKLLKDFTWLEHRTFQVINFMIIERAITAESLDENLFGTNCKPSHGGCALETSYILWDKQNLVKCPLYYVTATNVTKEGNFLVSAKDNLVFNIIKKIRLNHCENLEFYLSNQGLYLTSEKSSTLLPLVQNEFTDLSKIKLAESDLFSFRHREVQKHLAFEICLSLENILKIAALNNEKFIKITDANEKELVLYSNQGNMFIVKCQNLTNTTIEFIHEKENELCEENIKVKFVFDNNVFYGLLDFNGIIRPYEKSVCKILCRILDQTYYFDKSPRILRRQGDFFSLIHNTEKLQAKAINFGAIDISKFNFKHSKQILQAKDFANEFKTLFNQLDRETIARKDVANEIIFYKSKSDLFILFVSFKDWLYAHYLFLFSSIFITVILLILFTVFKIYRENICKIFFSLFSVCNKKFHTYTYSIYNCFLNMCVKKRIEKKRKNIESIEMNVLNKEETFLEPLDLKNTKSSQTSSSLISEYKTKVANYAKGNKNELISVNPKELKNNEIYNKLDSHKYENGNVSINKNKNISLSFI